ncbi:MAG: hypothetical protein SVW57_10455 [Thermodesulfobacteriota bacterium]|nr:hypothetical protein [Thermodesulfobacteriota bacterium]
MKPTLYKKARVLSLTMLVIFLFSSAFLNATEWMNPKKRFKDPNKARLPRERKELTELEKQEIKVYGFTGMELITYLYCNQDPGLHDRDSYNRFYNITPTGKILRHDFLDRFKYYYKNKVALANLDGIKPKDVYRK